MMPLWVRINCRFATRREHEANHIDIKKPGRIDGVGPRITGDRTGQGIRRGIR